MLLEVNTLPGLTPTSLLPRIAQGAGLAFDDLVEDLLGKERALVGVLSQRSSDVDEPTFKELYSVGTVARVVKVIRLDPATVFKG